MFIPRGANPDAAIDGFEVELGSAIADARRDTAPADLAGGGVGKVAVNGAVHCFGRKRGPCSRRQTHFNAAIDGAGLEVVACFQLGVLGDDGRLSMVGRLKDVFRVGGENVAPAEVEEVLLAHAAVATAQVIGVPDARLGEVPAAYVTLKAGHTGKPGATEDELIAWCKARCANFRVPRYLKIVADFEAIGMTGSGKVQKNKLRDHAIKELGITV